MRRVLVTGATGFVGRQALRPLAGRGFEVHAVARRPHHEPVATWHSADLLNVSELDRLLDDVRPSHLLHFAWYATHGGYWMSPENVRWVEASLRLLRGFRERDGARAVIAGTCAEYDWDAGVCVEQETPIRPRGLYGVAKDALRRVAEAYAAESDLGLAWGRIFFVFGPHEHPDRLVSSVARSLLAGRPAAVSDGCQRRDFLDVSSVGSAFAALVDTHVEGPVNIASGEVHAVREIVQLIGSMIGRSDLLQFGVVPSPASEAPCVAADIRRLRHEVGWRPERSLEDGLVETIEWWRN